MAAPQPYLDIFKAVGRNKFYSGSIHKYGETSPFPFPKTKFVSASIREYDEDRYCLSLHIGRKTTSIYGDKTLLYLKPEWVLNAKVKFAYKFKDTNEILIDFHPDHERNSIVPAEIRAFRWVLHPVTEPAKDPLAAEYDVIMEVPAYSYRHLTVFFSSKAIQASFKQFLEKFCETHSIGYSLYAAKLPSTIEWNGLSLNHNESIYTFEQIKNAISQAATDKRLSFYLK